MARHAYATFGVIAMGLCAMASLRLRAEAPATKPVVIRQVGDSLEVSLLRMMSDQYSDQRLAIGRLSVNDDQKRVAEQATDEGVAKISEHLKSVESGNPWTPAQRDELKRFTAEAQTRVVAAIGIAGAEELKRRLREPTFVGLHFARAVRGNSRWLNLTADQQNAMETVLAEAQEAFDRLPQEVPTEAGALEAFRSRNKAVQVAATAKLTALLTERQRKIVDPKSPVLLPRDDVDLPAPAPSGSAPPK